MSSAADEFNQLINNRDKPSAHPEDRSHLSDRDSSPDPDDLDLSDPEASDVMARTAAYTVPNTKFDANTGPKGVIADAQAFERARRSNFRKSFVSGSSPADRSRSHNHTSSKSSADAKLLRHSPHGSSASDADDGDEDRFMRRWRETRMQELQSHKGRRASPWRKHYGTVDTVDAVGYLDAIEKVPSDQIVVVCLYDPEVWSSCMSM